MKASRNAKGVNAEEWSKGGSFMRKPERGWLHSDQAIKEGGVCYALKYLGCIEVLKSMRTLQYDVRQHVTKEAMYRCCEANGYKFSKRKKASKTVLKLLADHPRTVHSDTFISLTVSVSGIVLTDMSSGEVISRHDMQGISFASGGEKDCPDIVGYVAKDAKNRRACHVLDCPHNLSYDVINTIGQAFELRYKMFLDDPPQLLTTPKRFVDTIFVEEEQPMDATYDEPKDEGIFVDEHKYHSIHTDSAMPLNEDNVSHAYQVPRSHEAPCVMSSYDTPNGTLEPDGPHYFEVEELTNKSASLEFAVGTQYHSAATGPPVTAPSYNNPLESEPHANSQNGFYDNPGMKDTFEPKTNTAPSRSNWETFDTEPDPVPRSMSPEIVAESPVNPGPPQNTADYSLSQPRKPPKEVSRKTPPPLPKPYARNKGSTPDQTVEDALSSSKNGLLDTEWFYGPMTRQDAEKLLSRDGDFLVRESTTNPGQYVLTGQQNGYPKHLLLVDPQGVVRTRDQSFDSVGHLISYHRENKVPIISSGSVLILRQPVVKNCSSQSHYERPVC